MLGGAQDQDQIDLGAFPAGSAWVRRRVHGGRRDRPYRRRDLAIRITSGPHIEFSGCTARCPAWHVTIINDSSDDNNNNNNKEQQEATAPAAAAPKCSR